MQIEHQCPQCGGPVVLEETDRLLSCSFCKTKLCIQPQDYLRYYFTPSDPFLEDVLFIPYWRFRGIHFLCKTSKIEDRVIDKNFLAIDSEHFNPTLGIRPQSLKLKFVQPMENARFVQPKTPFNRSLVGTKQTVTYEMVTVHETRLVRRGNEGDYAEVPETRTELKEERIFHESFIADTTSLIYTPVYIRNGRYYDAILNEPLYRGPAVYEPLPYEALSGSWKVGFLPTLCPNCGWDTIAERDSSVMFCKNCNSAWEAGENTLKRVDHAFVISKKVPEGTPRRYLPFWRIRADMEGVKLGCYADLVRLGNLPKVIQSGWEEPPFYFWTPAFKMTPAVYRRMSKQFTITNFTGEMSDSAPDSPIHSANLPLKDAIESLVTIIADLGIKKKEVLPLLPDIKIKVREALLVLFPFAETNHECVQPDIRCGFMKNALEWGRNI